MHAQHRKKACVQMITQECIVCFETFTVATRERLNKQGNGWSDPKRCLACSKKKAAGNKQRVTCHLRGENNGDQTPPGPSFPKTEHMCRRKRCAYAYVPLNLPLANDPSEFSDYGCVLILDEINDTVQADVPGLHAWKGLGFAPSSSAMCAVDSGTDEPLEMPRRNRSGMCFCVALLMSPLRPAFY